MISAKQTNLDLNPSRTSATHVIALLSALLFTACANKPATPDWQDNAFEALEGFTSAYLSGNTRLADLEFARVRLEISSTGRADLLARAELARCAARVASLEFDNCAGYSPLAQDALAPERSYADFLNGRWSSLDAALLPAQHRAIVLNAAPGPAADRPLNVTPATPAASLLSAMEDPLARLVAAGVLLQNARLTAPDIEVAIETASSQGWRRPLLAWLGVQLKRAQDAGEQAAASRLQRRIDLVLQATAKTP